MKKTTLLTCSLLITKLTFSQICDPNIHFRALGTSGNFLSMLNNKVRPLAYDSATHSLVFIHRNDPSLFGGTTGDLRYDVSSDTGNTWQKNKGILNPSVTATNGARYPQVAIQHPSTATTYSGNSLVYYAPTSTGTNFNGYVSGVRKLNNTGNTEHYNQVGLTNTTIPAGLCKGSGNTYWTVDMEQNQTTLSYGAIRILKGIYSSGDINWAVNKIFNPAYNTSYDGLAHVSDWNIAFDPTGQKGWVVLLTDLTGPAYTVKPVFYKTVNGGTTWTGPTELDLNTFPSITAIIDIGSLPTTAFNCGLSVDALGNPHLLVNVGSGSGSDYSITTSSQMSMYDITKTGSSWTAVALAGLSGLRGTIGTISHDNEPQVGRSLNGDLIAFTWTDTQGSVTNDFPDLYGMFYSVSSGTYSLKYDYSSCTPNAGKIIFPRMSTYLINKGNGNYQVPIVFGKINVSGSELDPASYYFIDDLLVNTCSFAPFTPTITANGPTTFCSGDSVVLSVTGSYNSYSWSNGKTTQSIVVKQSGNYNCAVTTSSGCSGSSFSTAVNVTPGPTVTISAIGNLQFCPGSSVELQASSPNAISYKWKKNGVAISGAVAPSYNVTSSGDYTCMVTNTCGSKTSNTLTATKLSAPTATVTPSGTVAICAGDTAVLTANTVSNATYKWYKGGTTISGATNQIYKATLAANYKVKITKSTTGCATTSANTTVQITCRQDEFVNEKFIHIFPNPSNGKFTFEWPSEMVVYGIHIYNNLGQEVLKRVPAMNTMGINMDLSGYPKGIYHVTILNSENELTGQRLVIE